MQTMDCRLEPKMGQVGSKWDGTFSDRVLVHIGVGPQAKCTEILSEKVPALSHLGPIGPSLCPNLTPLMQISLVSSLFMLYLLTFTAIA